MAADLDAMRTSRPRSQRKEQLPHWLAQDYFGGCPGRGRGCRMGLSQAGNLQQSFAGARKEAHQIAFFGPGFMDQLGPFG
ncbi:MAG: hypothetical protein QOI77_2765, partial [Blastocatellia bacterium]|nr:hypothetical protein [Blastocatellia bacterium]